MIDIFKRIVFKDKNGQTIVSKGSVGSGGTGGGSGASLDFRVALDGDVVGANGTWRGNTYEVMTSYRPDSIAEESLDASVRQKLNGGSDGGVQFFDYNDGTTCQKINEWLEAGILPIARSNGNHYSLGAFTYTEDNVPIAMFYSIDANKHLRYFSIENRSFGPQYVYDLDSSSGGGESLFQIITTTWSYSELEDLLQDGKLPILHVQDSSGNDLFYAYDGMVVSSTTSRFFSFSVMKEGDISMTRKQWKLPMGGNWFYSEFEFYNAGKIDDMAEQIDEAVETANNAYEKITNLHANGFIEGDIDASGNLHTNLCSSINEGNLDSTFRGNLFHYGEINIEDGDRTIQPSTMSDSLFFNDTSTTKWNIDASSELSLAVILDNNNSHPVAGKPWVRQFLSTAETDTGVYTKVDSQGVLWIDYDTSIGINLNGTNRKLGNNQKFNINNSSTCDVSFVNNVYTWNVNEPTITVNNGSTYADIQAAINKASVVRMVRNGEEYFHSGYGPNGLLFVATKHNKVLTAEIAGNNAWVYGETAFGGGDTSGGASKTYVDSQDRTYDASMRNWLANVSPAGNCSTGIESSTGKLIINYTGGGGGDVSKGYVDAQDQAVKQWVGNSSTGNCETSIDNRGYLVINYKGQPGPTGGVYRAELSQSVDTLVPNATDNDLAAIGLNSSVVADIFDGLVWALKMPWVEEGDSFNGNLVAPILYAHDRNDTYREREFSVGMSSHGEDIGTSWLFHNQWDTGTSKWSNRWTIEFITM